MSYKINFNLCIAIYHFPDDIVKKFFVQLQNEGKVVIIYNINGNGFKLL